VDFRRLIRRKDTQPRNFLAPQILIVVSKRERFDSGATQSGHDTFPQRTSAKKHQSLAERTSNVIEGGPLACTNTFWPLCLDLSKYIFQL
jgi:hypothetical protein